MPNRKWLLFFAVMFALTSVRVVYAQAPYRILLTNDDGYDSPGIMALYDELSAMPNTEILIVAPNVNYSGAGHWVNIREPFFVVDIKREDQLIGHHVNVPPASCVAIGVRSLMSPKPDLVISGVNRGANAGLVTLSSGTVAGAREGAMNGIQAIAVSLDRPRSRQPLDFAQAVQYARKIVEAVRKDPLPFGVFLNVNIPAQDREIQGIRATRQSNRDLEFEYIPQTSPFGRKLYWQTRKRVLESAEEGTDEWAMVNGFVSITPFQINQTTDVEVKGLKALVNE
jgi:5'-nucleotidase